MNDLARRRHRLQRARDLIRLEFAIAFTAPLVAGFLFIIAPGGHSPMTNREPPLVDTLLPWAGVAMFILGIVWMIRIYRADPEAGERTWRFRDF